MLQAGSIVWAGVDLSLGLCQPSVLLVLSLVVSRPARRERAVAVVEGGR